MVEVRARNLVYSVSRRVAALIERYRVSPDAIIIGTAIMVGIGAGLGAVVFRYLIFGVGWIGYTWLPKILSGSGRLYVILVPAAGGMLVGPLIYFFAREAKGHGVPEVMYAVALRGGRIRPIVAVVKALASAICIGSGGAVGREGPIVQIGSAIGSTVGQVFGLSPDRVRNLVACGAAAGIAATFNAPIAGVIFALEIILGEFGVRNFSSVVISSVVASIIGRAAFGNVPAFLIPAEYGVLSIWEYGCYAVLGVLAALVGVFFVRFLYRAEDICEHWRRVPEWFQPAVGGIMLGILALAYPYVTGVSWDRVPQVFNVGYEVIEGALGNRLFLKTAVVLLFLKILATSLTLGTGGSGGVFAPSLFMGAMLGAAFGVLVQHLLPGLVAPPGAYALVAMGAVFAACTHAPLTAILILLELTGNYRILLPLMLTVVVSTVIGRKLLAGESIYTIKLVRRGIHLRHGQDVDILESVRVEEVMSTDAETVAGTLTIANLSEVFSRSRHRGIGVLDSAGKLCGIVTIHDLNSALESGLSPDTTVADIATPTGELTVAYPDETVGQAMQRMARRGLPRLPVVARSQPGRFLGFIRREALIRAYELGLSRRPRGQATAPVEASASLAELSFTDFHILPADYAVEKTVQELLENVNLDCLLICVQRKSRSFIPKGDTRMEVGDRITAVASPEVRAQLIERFRSGVIRSSA